MKQGLVLIDLQNDYFSGGMMELVGIDKAANNANRLLIHARQNLIPIYHIQHLSVRPGANFFIPETFGAQIHKLVTPLKAETVIQKNFPNSFRNTNLLTELKADGVEELIIAGAMSHMCVDATTRAAFDYEFHCVVIEDACATKDLTFGDLILPANYVHAGFMSALSGIYAKIFSSDDFLATT